MATTATSSRIGDDDLLEPFLEAVLSDEATGIPSETLLGAITHFLSTLPHGDVPRLVRALIHSPTLWVTQQPSRIREAISLGVRSKIDMLNTRYKEAWLPRRKVSSATRQWLKTILEVLHEDEHAESHTMTHIRLGLLSGMSAQEEVECHKTRAQLEEDIVLALADMLPVTYPSSSTAPTYLVDLIGAALAAVEADRMRVLDLEVGGG